MSKSSFVLPAPELQTDYQVFLNTPKEDPTAPMVIVLDGDDQFDAAVKAARELERKKVIPSLALVGIGYGGGYRSPLNRRGRDYTPTKLKDEPMESGGAEAFHTFLENHLVPAVKEREGRAPRSLGLTGHSLGSLFGLHALFRPKPFFDYFLISSPSIWWDDRSVLRALTPGLNFSEGRLVKAYLSVGDEDTPSMTGDLTLLENQLAQYSPKGLNYTVERLAKRDHITALPIAFQQGFRWLYSSAE